MFDSRCSQTASDEDAAATTEKTATFKIHRGKPIGFSITFKDKAELFSLLKEQLVGRGIPVDKIYSADSESHKLIENADDLIRAITNEVHLKLYTSPADDDIIASTDTDDSDDERHYQTRCRKRRRHCRHPARFDLVSPFSVPICPCNLKHPRYSYASHTGCCHHHDCQCSPHQKYLSHYNF
ncbi:unnamed protein product [Heligmosomoides polygyrus]|uniref:PB1 domain-containing protein n=1 Tax=Heligmosomoides polygyrus TaxID=6339 RepID=A0A183FU47_HELPZ|nr:unnamed protein product [Heligmosomoides polygyrus]